MITYNRRSFLQTSAGAMAALWTSSSPFGWAQQRTPLFEISLAQWSLHRAFFGREGAEKRDPLDFARIARQEFDIFAVEYVNQFYKDKKHDQATLQELKRRADDVGVRNVLIMCDGEGALGDPDAAKRRQAVENHFRWVEWAKYLGCHSIRVNAASRGGYWEQVELAADGLRQLTEFASQHEINVIVENHGGLSSNGAWLAEVMRRVNHPRCGTLPDFGNFRVMPNVHYDRYEGVKELMPFAKGVSAKSHDFDEQGNEIHTDYRRMLQIVLSFGYRGYIGIEYEGQKLSEPEGIRATKKLLERLRDDLSR
ncbi:MAG: xylose isomerase [Planctomycetaceae bacterium]|nr:MAG: xylose isomerase [Planctomycetaceae bacterium]